MAADKAAEDELSAFTELQFGVLPHRCPRARTFHFSRDHGRRIPEVVSRCQTGRSYSCCTIVGKNKLKTKSSSPSAAPIRPSIEPRKRNGGIRKPSAVMRKTLKKMAKKREMDMS